MQHSTDTLLKQNSALSERLAAVRRALEEAAEDSPVAASALSWLQHLLLCEKDLAVKKMMNPVANRNGQSPTAAQGDAVDEFKNRFFKFVDDRRRDYKEEFTVLQLKLQASECASTELAWKKVELARVKAESNAILKDNRRLTVELEDIIAGLDSARRSQSSAPTDSEFDSLFNEAKGDSSTGAVVSPPAEPLWKVIAGYRSKLEEEMKKVEMLSKDNEGLLLRLQTSSDEYFAQKMAMDDMKAEISSLRDQQRHGSNNADNTSAPSHTQELAALRSELERERQTSADVKQRIQKMQLDSQALRESKKEAERRLRMLEVEQEASRDDDLGGGGGGRADSDDSDNLKRKVSKLLAEKEGIQVKLEEANDETNRFKQLYEAASSELENTQVKLKFVESSVQTMRSSLQHAERSNTKLSNEIEKLKSEPRDAAPIGNEASIFTLYVTYRLWAERARNSRKAETVDAETQSAIQTDDLEVNDGAIRISKLQLVNKELQKDLSKSNQRLRSVESELATFKDLYLKARDGKSNQQQQHASSEDVVVAPAKPRSTPSPNTTVPDSEGPEMREWMLEQQRNDAVYALEAMEKHRDLLQEEVDRQGLLMQQMFVSQRQGGTTPQNSKQQQHQPPPPTSSPGGLRSFFGGSSVKSAEGEVKVLNARVKSLQSLLESQLKENMDLSSQLEALKK